MQIYERPFQCCYKYNIVLTGEGTEDVSHDQSLRTPLTITAVKALTEEVLHSGLNWVDAIRSDSVV